MSPRVVIDTCVLVAGLRSDLGASFRLLTLVGTGQFEICLSVPLFLEYEDATKRQSRSIGLTHREIDDVLNYLCSAAVHRKIYFLWRPMLNDPGDDMLLELAVEAQCDSIVTHNIKDFVGASTFGIDVITPVEFLRKIGDVP